LINKVFFVLAEVLSADVLDFIQLFVVFFGEVDALLLSLRRDAGYICGQLISSTVELSLKELFELAHLAVSLGGLVIDGILVTIELGVLVNFNFVDFSIDLFLLTPNLVLKIFTDFFNSSVDFLNAFGYGSNVTRLILKDVFLTLLSFLESLDVAGVGCHSFGVVSVLKQLILLELPAGAVNYVDFLPELVF